MPGHNHLHVQSPEALDPLRDRLLVSQVEEIYEFQSVLPAADQGLFPASLPDALHFSRSTLTTWRKMTNPAIDAALASLDSSHPQPSPFSPLGFLGAGFFYSRCRRTLFSIRMPAGDVSSTFSYGLR